MAAEVSPVSGIVREIHHNHLTCQICQASYRRPKALPCLHTFCSLCLHEYIFSRSYDSRGVFPCPICRSDCTIPADGVEALPDNHLINNLLDTISHASIRHKSTGGNQESPFSPDTSPPCTPDNPQPMPTGCEEHQDEGCCHNNQDSQQAGEVCGEMKDLREEEEISEPQAFTQGNPQMSHFHHRPVPTPRGGASGRGTSGGGFYGHVHTEGEVGYSQPGFQANATFTINATTDPDQPGGKTPSCPDPDTDSDDCCGGQAQQPRRPPPPSISFLSPQKRNPNSPSSVPSQDGLYPNLAGFDFKENTSPLVMQDVSPSGVAPPKPPRRPPRPPQPKMPSEGVESEASALTNVLQRKVHLPQKAAELPLAKRQYGAELCFGKWGTGVADFNKPEGLAVAPDGNIIVADNHGNRILVFDRIGNITTMFTCGSPIRNIFCGPDGRLFAASSKSAKCLVVCYNLQGHTIGKFGNFYTFENPYGVALTASNHIVVTSVETNLLYIMSADTGRLVRKITGKGKDGKRLNLPYHVTINRKDDIVVSDYGNDSVKVFDQQGKCKYQFGSTGRKPGQFNGPKGLCVDKNHNIIVADSGNNRVQIFGRQGNFVDVAMEIPREDTRNSGVPVNVAMLGEERLVVLLAGAQQCQVRVYRYSADKPGINMVQLGQP